jgi:hypothetical protein
MDRRVKPVPLEDCQALLGGKLWKASTRLPRPGIFSVDPLQHIRDHAFATSNYDLPRTDARITNGECQLPSLPNRRRSSVTLYRRCDEDWRAACTKNQAEHEASHSRR